MPSTFPLDGIVRAESNHHQALLTVSSYDPAMDDALMGNGAESVEVLDLSLEEIFARFQPDPLLRLFGAAWIGDVRVLPRAVWRRSCSARSVDCC